VLKDGPGRSVKYFDKKDYLWGNPVLKIPSSSGQATVNAAIRPMTRIATPPWHR